VQSIEEVEVYSDLISHLCLLSKQNTAPAVTATEAAKECVVSTAYTGNPKLSIGQKVHTPDGGGTIFAINPHLTHSIFVEFLDIDRPYYNNFQESEVIPF
jgi:hypothetical protein